MSLLLLPALTPPVSRSTWWTAYKSTIEDVLKQLRPSNDHEIARLDIAIVLSPAFASSTNRIAFYPQFQDLLREVYSLVCISANQAKVDLDFPGGVDARVILLDPRVDLSGDLLGKQQFSGPVIDLHSFVAARRPYQTLYSVESESGENVLNDVLQIWRQRSPEPEVSRLRCGTSIGGSTESAISESENSSNTAHTSVAVGGTFDHLHIGHKLLLAATVYVPQPNASSSSSSKRTITIGITGDELLVNKKHGSLVESWEERQQRTAAFVDSILVFHPNIASVRTVQETNIPGPNGKNVKVTYGNEVEINYTQISDPFGPTITVEEISALIISAETRVGGKAVNDKRTEKGWKALDIFEVDVLDTKVDEDFKGPASDGQTFENKISSTEIRRKLEAKAKTPSGHL